MATFVEVVTKYAGPYKYYILALVLLIIFLVITATFYPTFLKNTENKEENDAKDVANSNRRNPVATIFFFNVDWCPHCKTALPEWKTFKSQYHGKVINSYKIECVNVNCTDESDANVTTIIQKYKIESYPTVKMLKGTDVIDFDSKITSTALDKFVNTMLN
jgi:thioredoxin-like negative regulator of GroEL